MFLFSLEGWSYLKPQGFNNFRNYAVLLKDPHFYSTMINNVIIILGVVPATAIIALAFGQAIFSRIPGYRLYTFLFFIPVVLPDVVIARTLKEHPIIVAGAENTTLVQECKMTPAPDIEAAIRIAEKKHGARRSAVSASTHVRHRALRARARGS